MEVRPVSEVEQSPMLIEAVTKKLSTVTPDRVKSLAELAAIAEHKTKALTKRRKKNKVAKASRRRNR